ncbi:MAG: helix-turn-helix domain-containing protein [Planctomycetota bacterium]
MRETKRKQLKAAGWRVGSAKELLGLTDEESALIEMRLALAVGLKKHRQAKHLSQVEFAEQIGSSQSRVAKMEAADPSVSLDLLVRALLALGVSRKILGGILARGAA